MKKITSSSLPRTVLRLGLVRLLRQFRESRNESQEDVSRRMNRLLSGSGDELPNGLCPFAVHFRQRGIDAVEEAEDGLVELTYADAQFLADAYAVDRLLVDPVFSVPSVEDWILERFEDCLVVGDSMETRAANAYGVRACYRTPDRMLRGADDVAVVHLRLEPAGRSAVHWHPGEELMYVLDGEIDVLFRQSGLRARLTRGDFIHFYSEQEHCAIAGNQAATLFIVRFRPSERRRLVLQAAKGQLAKSRSSQDLRALLASPAPPPEEDARSSRAPERPVVDRGGLGHLLTALCQSPFRGPRGRLTLDQLARVGESAGFNRGKLYRMHHGTAPVTRADLLALAPLYDVEPMLLYDYLFPVLRDTIVIREQPQPQLGDLDSSDYVPIPGDFFAGGVSSYRVPCRRLANTDTSIALLELPPGATTPANRHPGRELLLPLEGAFELRIGGLSTHVNAARQGFVHFTSSREHVIKAVGEPVKMLVLRTYGSSTLEP